MQSLYVSEHLSIYRTPVALELKLVYDEKPGGPVPPASILVVDRGTKVAINDQAKGTIRVKITECSMNHGNKSFRLQITPKGDGM
jgi:hypothetical protein